MHRASRLVLLATVFACGEASMPSPAAAPPASTQSTAAPSDAPAFAAGKTGFSASPIIDPALNVPDDPPPHLVHDGSPHERRPRKPRKTRPSEVVHEYVPPPVVTTVIGRVLDPDGTARAGAVVIFTGGAPAKAQTDADGRFRLELRDEDLRLVIREQRSFVGVQVDLPDREPARSGALLLLPGEVDAGELRLLPAAELDGRCVDESGRPVQGVAIRVHTLVRDDGNVSDRFAGTEIWWPNDSRNEAKTDADGRFRLPRLPPGLCNLDFEHADFRNVCRGGVRVPLGGCDLGDCWTRMASRRPASCFR
jgi:hypothetical protein